MNIDEKLKKLNEYMRDNDGAAVAFSGGVDSTFLLKAAHDLLGDRIAAITIRSRLIPERELSEAVDFCQSEGINQIFLDFEPFDTEDFAENPQNRCYICKKACFSGLIELAAQHGFSQIGDGTKIDDEGDYRPGMKASEELGVKSPLRETGMSKSDIRLLSERLGLKTWNKPSFACLASRFRYGERITAEKLEMVEKAEQLLFDMGFHQFRARIQGLDARIEVSDGEIDMLMKKRGEILSEFEKYGFEHVSADLRGYRTSVGEAPAGSVTPNVK